MINVIYAADITFIMSSSTSAWLLSPLECSPHLLRNRMAIIEFGFRMIYFVSVSEADNTDLGFDNS